MSEFSHLDELEAEAIYIIREVAAECEKPVMLYSIGKDSSVMLHLAMKAFYPEKPPFPFLHVNTTWKFKEMIAFRDRIAKEKGIEMLEYINQDGVKQGINPFDHGAAYTDIMKTQALKQALNKYGFTFQKKFGQNFLIDTHVLEKIISAAGITKNDCVLEIGPGIGTMTQYLAENAGHVVAVEIDRNLIPILKETLADYDNVTVINEDILRVDIKALAEEYNGGKPIKVVANLPYYITTPIIMGLFESGVPIDNITVMVQKEVADRMKEGPGSKDYGALSLAVQYYAEPEIVANVPPNCFIPRQIGRASCRERV